MKKTAIYRAAEHVGGQSALARMLNVTPQSVQQWVSAGHAPVRRCVSIEIATDGAVTRYELCPEVFGTCPPETVAG